MQRTDKPCRITPAGRALHNPVGRVDDRASDAHTVLDRLRPDDCLCVLGEGYMTKRDRQTREYAAESYEKGDEIRTNTTTNRDTTPAVGSVQRDLVERLRRWVVATDAVPASDLMDEAADEIARLREAIRRLADQDATLSVQGGSVTVTMDATLTDEEREAIEWFAEVRKPLTRLTQSHNREKYKDTLRGLLERTSHDAVPEAKADGQGRDNPDTPDHVGTGNTPSDAEIDALEFVVVMGRVANGWDKDILRQWLIRLRPEFDSAKAIKEGESDRSQPIGSPAKTNPTQPRNGTPAEGTEQGECSVPDSRSENEPVAWAVENASVATGLAWLIKREAVDFSFQHGGRIVPLYSSPTLTDEEREAVETAVRWLEPYPQVASTLRKLLERIGGER